MKILGISKAQLMMGFSIDIMYCFGFGRASHLAARTQDVAEQLAIGLDYRQVTVPLS